MKCIASNSSNHFILIQVLELVVNLVLAFNLHFELPTENTVMQVLAERGTAKFFTERLMFLVNMGGKLSILA